MKSSCLLLFLILIFSVNSFGREFSKEDLDQVFRESNQGNPKAQAYLASMYYNGEGVAQDSSEAAKWFQKSADQGNSTAADWYNAVETGDDTQPVLLLALLFPFPHSVLLVLLRQHLQGEFSVFSVYLVSRWDLTVLNYPKLAGAFYGCIY